MTRAFKFLALAAISAAACAEVPDAVVSDEPEVEGYAPEIARLGDTRVRVMAANITTGNDQAYHDPGIRIFKGLQPDVAMIQEFNYGSNSDTDLRSFVDQAFGPGFSYWRHGGAQIPNGVISRWPIVESGEWTDPSVSNRAFTWARIDIPGPVDLYAVSLHLLTAGASERSTEAHDLLTHLQTLPAGSYLVIGGDFNTKARDEDCVNTLGQVVVTAGPWPVDGNGNDRTNASRAQPYDWVLANPAIDGHEIPLVVGNSTFSNGLVVDSRVYAPLSDIVPVRATDSGETNMQHMAVVRDFLVPGDAVPDPKVAVTAPNGGESWAAGSTHDLTFTSTAVGNVKVEVTLDGTSYTTVAASVPATDGKVSWTVPASATSAARVRVSEAATGRPSDTSDGPFSITLPQTPGKAFINEVLANEPGSDQAGEFVEIVNGGQAEVDLSGYTISDSKALRHVFAAGTKLAAGRAILVYGAASGIPAGVTGAVGSSTGLLSFTNTGDSVILADSHATVVDSLTYASTLASRDGLSMNRSPDASAAGTFVTHDTISTLRASPGTRADGSAFGGGGPGPGPGPGGITAEVEPNDSAATASGPVQSTVSVAGAIGTSTDADWYKVTTAASGQLNISVAITGTADLDWYLYPSGNTTTYLARGYTTKNPEAGGASVAAGTYLVKVVGYQGAMASYRLTVTGTTTP